MKVEKEIFSIENKTISAVKQRDKNYSIMVEEEWYGGYGFCKVNKGDIVSFKYTVNDQWKNIKGEIVTVHQNRPSNHTPNRTLNQTIKAADKVDNGLRDVVDAIKDLTQVVKGIELSLANIDVKIGENNE